MPSCELQNRVSIPSGEGYESSLDADPSANRNDWSRTSGLVIPNQAFCQLNYTQKLRVAGAGIATALAPSPLGDRRRLVYEASGQPTASLQLQDRVSIPVRLTYEANPDTDPLAKYECPTRDSNSHLTD